jgi:hypothetical protein
MTVVPGACTLEETSPETTNPPGWSMGWKPIQSLGQLQKNKFLTSRRIFEEFALSTESAVNRFPVFPPAKHPHSCNSPPYPDNKHRTRLKNSKPKSP